MEALDYVIWSVVILVLVGALLLSLVASRPATPAQPGMHWLIVPVVAVVIGYFIFVASGGLDSLHGEGGGFLVAVTIILTLIGIIGGSPLVAIVLNLSKNEGTPGVHGGILVPVAGSAKEQQEILRGGATIGYLERFMIMASVSLGFTMGLLPILVLKGIARYSELAKSNGGGERFIIGTFVSFGWAMVCIAPITGLLVGGSIFG